MIFRNPNAKDDVKKIFKILVKLNNIVLPSYKDKDPAKLTKVQQAILGYRYWALINSL